MTYTGGQKIYTGIDLFKLIAAILVVLLHSIETTAWYPNEIKFVFTRLAVPFFFIASGFFFQSGLEKSKDKKEFFLNYEKKILTIFIIVGVIIYSPVTIITYIQKYPEAGIFKMSFYIFRRVFLIGPGPYWYLLALMWSAAFLYLCNVKKWDWLVYGGIVIGLLLEIAYACFRGVLSSFTLFDYFFKVIYLVFSWEFNFIMFGIPFMGIGYLISKKKYKVNIKVSSGILVISTVARVFEYNFPKLILSSFWDFNNISFAFIAQAISFFFLAKEIDLPVGRSTSLKIRQISSCIYFSHAIFLYNVINPLLDMFTDIPTYDAICIFPKMVIVIALCLLLYVFIRKIDNKYLNVLING